MSETKTGLKPDNAEIPGQQQFDAADSQRQTLTEQIALDIARQVKDAEEEALKAQKLNAEGETPDDEELEEDAPTGNEGDDGATQDEEEDDEDSDEQDDETDAETGATNKIKIGDRELDEDTAKEAVAVLDWANSLTPEAKDIINGLFDGRYQAVPAQTISHEAKPDLVPEIDDSDEYLDPKAAAEIKKLRERVEVYEQSQTNERMNWFRAETDKGINSFQTAHELSDQEMLDLNNKLAQSNILPGIAAGIQQRKGAHDPSEAVQQALNMVYASDPDYQQRELDRLIAQERDKEAQTKDRKRKAGSLSGKGGSVSREPAQPTKGMTLADKTTAIAAELRESGAF